MIMNQKQKWDEYDKEKLVKLAQQYVGCNKRIDWMYISQQYEKRTANQCKQYYRNVINDNNYQKGKINNLWSSDMKNQLLCRVDFYGKKWTFLKNNYYPDYTTMQLRQQYRVIQKWNKKMQKMAALIDENRISEISTKQLKKFHLILIQTLYKDQLLQRKLQTNDISTMFVIDPIDLRMYQLMKKKKEFSKAQELATKIKNYLQ